MSPIGYKLKSGPISNNFRFAPDNGPPILNVRFQADFVCFNRANAVRATVGYKLRLVLKWLRALLRKFRDVLIDTRWPRPHVNPARIQLRQLELADPEYDGILWNPI